MTAGFKEEPSYSCGGQRPFCTPVPRWDGRHLAPGARWLCVHTHQVHMVTLASASKCDTGGSRTPASPWDACPTDIREVPISE